MSASNLYMHCNFCQKKDGVLQGHVCAESIEFNKQVKAYFETKTDDILMCWASGEVSGAEELTKIYIKIFLKETPKYSHIDVETLSIPGLVGTIRAILKLHGVYKRSMPGRVQKLQETMRIRYGVTNPGQLQHNKNKLIERNNALVYKLSYHEKFKSYSKEVEYLTKKK